MVLKEELTEKMNSFKEDKNGLKYFWFITLGILLAGYAVRWL